MYGFNDDKSKRDGVLELVLSYTQTQGQSLVDALGEALENVEWDSEYDYSIEIDGYDNASIEPRSITLLFRMSFLDYLWQYRDKPQILFTSMNIISGNYDIFQIIRIDVFWDRIFQRMRVSLGAVSLDSSGISIGAYNPGYSRCTIRLFRTKLYDA